MRTKRFQVKLPCVAAAEAEEHSLEGGPKEWMAQAEVEVEVEVTVIVLCLCPASLLLTFQCEIQEYSVDLLALI